MWRPCAVLVARLVQHSLCVPRELASGLRTEFRRLGMNPLAAMYYFDHGCHPHAPSSAKPTAPASPFRCPTRRKTHPSGSLRSIRTRRTSRTYTSLSRAPRIPSTKEVRAPQTPGPGAPLSPPPSPPSPPSSDPHPPTDPPRLPRRRVRVPHPACGRVPVHAAKGLLPHAFRPLRDPRRPLRHLHRPPPRVLVAHQHAPQPRHQHPLLHGRP